MACCSLIFSKMEKSLGFHECGPKGLSNFGFFAWKRFPLNYYSEWTKCQRSVIQAKESTGLNESSIFWCISLAQRSNITPGNTLLPAPELLFPA